MRKWLQVTILILSVVLLTPTSEAMIVSDPWSLAQQISAYIRQYNQLIYQIQQYESQLVSLANEAKNLLTFPSTIVGQIKGSIQLTLGLIKKIQTDARGIAYNYGTVATQFDHIYPSYGGDTILTPAQYADRVKSLFTQTHNAMYDSMTAQGLASPEQMQSDDDMLQSLIDASNDTEGALQAAQAGNQIAAMIAQQLMAQKKIMATAYRAEASYYEQKIQTDSAQESDIRRMGQPAKQQSTVNKGDIMNGN